MKSNNILSYFLLILFVILGVSSCKDDEPTNTNNNSNKSGAILKLEYKGNTETYIQDYVYLNGQTCLTFNGPFRSPVLIGSSSETLISADLALHQSAYPLKVKKYVLGNYDCSAMNGANESASYFALEAVYGVFDFGDFKEYTSINGNFNITAISENKISFIYTGAVEVYDPFEEITLGTINVTYEADNIDFEDSY